jgi:hypothetical protein
VAGAFEKRDDPARKRRIILDKQDSSRSGTPLYSSHHRALPFVLATLYSCGAASYSSDEKAMIDEISLEINQRRSVAPTSNLLATRPGAGTAIA